MRGNLPWNDAIVGKTGKEHWKAVKALKEKFILPQFLLGVTTPDISNLFKDIFTHIETLEFDATPNYSLLHEYLEQILKQSKARRNSKQINKEQILMISVV